MSHRVLCDELSSTDDWPQAHSEMRLDVGPLPPFSPPPSLFYPALRTSEQFPEIATRRSDRSIAGVLQNAIGYEVI